MIFNGLPGDSEFPTDLLRGHVMTEPQQADLVLLIG